MAGNIKGITIEIGGETTGLQNALKGVNSQSIELQKELKQVDNLLKFNPGNAELVSQKQKLLADQVTVTTNKLKQLKDAQSQVDAQFASGKINEEQYRAFNRELAATEGSLNGLKNKFAGLQAEQGRIESSTRQLNTLFDATGTSVDQYANALGSGLVNAIKNGTASSKQLDDAISKIGQAALGSSTDIDKMKKALSSVDDGASLNSVKKDLSEVAKEASQAGDKVNGFGDDLEGVVAGLAAGGGIAGVVSTALDTSSLNTKIDISFDVPEASKASVRDAINTVTSYGVDAEAALEGVRRQWALNKDASDESNAAVIEAAGTIAAAYSGIDFTELIQETNEISKELNISNEEALGLTTSLLKMGFPPEQLDIIAEYGGQLKRVGYNAEEIQALFAAGVDTGTWNIDNLMDGLKEGRVRVAEFGDEVPKALKGLLEGTDISAKQMQDWGVAVSKGGEGGSKAMTEIATALNGVDDETKKNLLGVQIFGTMYEDQGQNIIDTLLNAKGATVDLKDGQDQLNDSTSKLNADPAIAMKKAFSDLKVALTPLLTTIAEVIGKIAEWVQNNPTLSATIAAVVAGIGILVGFMIALAPLFTAIATAAGLVTFSLGAIIGIVAGVVIGIGLLIAAGVAIYKNWDEISAAASNIWGGIKDFLSTCWEGIKTAAVTIWDGLTNFFKTWGTTILAVITGPIGILVGLIVKNWDTIKATTQTVWNGLKTFLSNLWNGIKSTASTVWNGIKTYFSTVLNAYKTLFTTIWNGIKTVVTNVWNGLKTTATTVWNSIKTYFTTVLNAYKTLFTTIWNAIKSVTTTVFNAIKTTITTVWNSIKSTTTTVLNGIKTVTTTIWNGIKTTISTVLNGIKTVVSTVWNGIKSTVSSVMSGIKTVISNGWNGAKTIVNTAVNGIKTVVSTIFNSLKTVVSSAMGKVKTAIETGWNAAKSFLDGISLISVGKNIIEGLVSGINGMFGKVKTKISELAGLIPEWAKEILGIHSPSRVMAAEVGKWIPEGIAVGIENNLDSVKKASAKMAAAAIPDFSSNIAITKTELDKLNKVISSVVNSHAKEISKIQKDADKQRETITSDANKKILEIEKKAKESKKALTAAQERQIVNIYDKAYKDRAKVTADETKKISAIDKSLNADKLKALEEYVDKRIGLESMTAEQEVEFWQAAVKKFKNGTEEKIQAQIKLNKAMDTLNKEQFDKEKTYIEDKKYYNKLSLSEELAAYQQYLKEHKKGSEERIYYEKEIYRVKQEIQNQIDQINEDYLSKVQTLNQNLIDEEYKLNEEYKKAFDDRAKSLYSFAGIFDEIAEKDISGDTLLNNLSAQVTAFEDWQKNISELASKGINDGLLAELQEMGPKAGAEIAALNTLTDEQLQQYVSLWVEKNRLATEQATNELEGMKLMTGIKIEELKTDTAAKLVSYQEEWRKAMAGAKIKVKNEAKEMPSIGEYAVSGLINGLLNKKSALLAAVQELASIVTGTFQAALDIHSPSRVFKGFGININEGLIQGIHESSRQLDQAINSVYGSMANSAEKMLQSNGSINTSNGSTPATTTIVENHYNWTYHSPKAIDPYESSRLTRNSLRELALQV